jgi:hypothetical protein
MTDTSARVPWWCWTSQGQQQERLLKNSS